MRVLSTSHMGAQADTPFAPAPDHAVQERFLAEGGGAFTSLRHGLYAESALEAARRTDLAAIASELTGREIKACDHIRRGMARRVNHEKRARAHGENAARLLPRRKARRLCRN